MDRQPYIYTLPEQFIDDESVPLHWKLYTLINGFWISGKTVYASNSFFAEKLKCSERHVRRCLDTLEGMNLLDRVVIGHNRNILPRGGGHAMSGGADLGGPGQADLGGPPISDSIISDNLITEQSSDDFSFEQDEDTVATKTLLRKKGIQAKGYDPAATNRLLQWSEAFTGVKFYNAGKQKRHIAALLQGGKSEIEMKDLWINCAADDFFGKSMDWGSVLSFASRVKAKAPEVMTYKSKK